MFYFVVTERFRKTLPNKITNKRTEDGDIIYQSDRCIIRRTSARLNISSPKNNASSRSQSITPKQEDPSLCFNSKRCAIRRATSNKSSALNETSSSNRASRTLVIEVSSIYNNPGKGDGSSGISTRRSKSTSTSVSQNEDFNRTPHEEHSSKDLVSSIDSGMSLHNSAESLPTTDAECTKPPTASPKSSSPGSIQASLSEAVRKLKLLSNQTVSKTTNELRRVWTV
ncbi:unnamed protein product [Acanthoscelides obtectus]|uniref:Uncharacterized protein n=1 Tax=Acanthoscelides obtectus TaxID=200917 RepID=A0A9P0QD72_ACAOB|nr:unnamed protein product [Acanthoscelides obtectus]CAK1686298.1 hypothetical protein AOBTE_LOCUS35903 [Acanthoscelides obtectus]